MTQPNVDPKDIYGEDLAAVFGPKVNRKHIKQLSRKERRAIIAELPRYVSTDVLGDDPTLFQVANLVLSVLKRTRALQNVDLEWHTTQDLKDNGLVRSAEMFKPVTKIHKNNKVQRGIQLRHLVEDILFNFNPEWVLMGLARYSKTEDRYYLNDAQHRYIACIILGIRDIPLEFKESELRSDDVWQYSAVNLRSLIASEFDKYRNKVQAVDSLIAENPNVDFETLDQDFVNAYTIRNILARFGAELIEKGGESKTGPLQCTGTGNLVKHFEDYGEAIFTRAVAIHTEVFNKAPLTTQNIWAISEFIKIQEEANVLGNNAFKVDMAITDALLHRYPNGNRNGFYIEVQRVLRSSPMGETNIPLATIWSAGIHKIIQITSPEVKWAPVKFNGAVVADKGLKAYRVPPVQHAVEVA
jgi:hypothetical protein